MGSGEPAGWREVMDAAKAQASCRPSPWGGVITVHPAPFLDGWGIKVWGSNPSDERIDIVYAPQALDTALPEEACHAWLSICEKDYTEPPAKACAARVIEALR